MGRRGGIKGTINGHGVALNQRHLAGEGSALPAQRRTPPAVDVIAAVVGMPAPIEDEIVAVTIPGKGTPGADQRANIIAIERAGEPQIRGSPDVGKGVLIYLGPCPLRHRRNDRQQGIQVLGKRAWGKQQCRDGQEQHPFEEKAPTSLVRTVFSWSVRSRSVWGRKAE